jgi:uncharacterized protein YecE (DUF72 family)
LFQLPPFFKQDLGVLEEFLTRLPPGLKAAFEFRHPSWFDDSLYSLLSKHGAALCGGDLDDAAKSPPFVRTAPFGYLRLRRSDYTDADLERWANSIRDQNFEGVFAFFKHEEKGPELALRLDQLLA